jgi:hypothetical protein
MKIKFMNEPQKPQLNIGDVCCPKCGSSNYEEFGELMYENGIDDPQYGGELKMIKYGDCRDCG